ncbi:MAG: hypothetical protein KIT09_36110 [Bryobacteraceae bacterium]|nr:hypothetical protein [Bryobacteraceae bacterium]
MAGEDRSDDLIAEISEALREEERKSQPSPSLEVYCDQHLSVTMVHAVTWLLAEYGESAADVNPLIFWRCPKVGCQRCYHPTKFGYFSRSSNMESRIQVNTTKQERCLTHEAEPFMYIGRVQQSRQFLCPFYRCNERGSLVAAFVVDEAIACPDDSLVGLKKAARKRSIEMTTFRSFAAASGIALDGDSAVNVDPPHPDILCTISGKWYWFELGQIISQKVAAQVSPSRKLLEGGFSFSQEMAFIEIVNKKATKTYDTNGFPVDLILWFDLRLGSEGTIARLIGKHGGILKSLIGRSPFSRVWIFDACTNSSLWP